MRTDDCIVVDEADNILRNASKYDAHRFETAQPTGLLHRAFSVFLFNSDNKLLLQQRASSKITFPDVWTNTCCSHPLFAVKPSEVDLPDDVSAGRCDGVKNAAIRKLEQELGISLNTFTTADFKYLTRLHYCAADTNDQGVRSGWGEHEVDYILFVKADVKLSPNPDEVRDVKYVDQAELAAMMRPESGLKWSPWFRIIAKQFLPLWWKDLNKTITTNDLVDYSKIHKF